jgi:SAM-dependent methyltransferase
MESADLCLAGLQDAYRASVQLAHWQGQSRRTALGNAGFLLPHLRPGMRVLDVGCGVGSITRGLADVVGGAAHRAGKAVGVDANVDAIVEARRAVAAGLRNVEFMVADLYGLPFEGASFDAIFAHGVAQHLTDPLAGLSELRRVLRPGGVLGVVDAERDSRVLWPEPPLVLRAIELMDLLNDTDSGWTFPQRAGSDVRIGRRLRELVHRAGFRDAEASVSTVCDGTPQATRAAGDHEARLLEVPELVEFVVARGSATRAELARMAEAWRQWGQEPGAFRAEFRCEVLGWR